MYIKSFIYEIDLPGKCIYVMYYKKRLGKDAFLLNNVSELYCWSCINKQDDENIQIKKTKLTEVSSFSFQFESPILGLMFSLWKKCKKNDKNTVCEHEHSVSKYPNFKDNQFQFLILLPHTMDITTQHVS